MRQQDKWAKWHESNNQAAPPNHQIANELVALAGIFRLHFDTAKQFEALYADIFPPGFAFQHFGFPKCLDILKHDEYASTNIYQLLDANLTWYKSIIPTLVERIPGIEKKLCASPDLVYKLAHYYSQYVETNDIEKTEKDIKRHFMG